MHVAEKEFNKAAKLNAKIEKPVIDYINWFMEEFSGSPDDQAKDQTMQTVLMHTGTWAESNVLINLLDNLDASVAAAAKSHKKKLPMGQQQILRRILVAKALHEVYGSNQTAAATTFGFCDSEAK